MKTIKKMPENSFFFFHSFQELFSFFLKKMEIMKFAIVYLLASLLSNIKNLAEKKPEKHLIGVEKLESILYMKKNF